MFLLNSRLGLFTAACSRRHPFSRSYGANLPSSLTTLLPLALGSSPHLPVSVCGTGALVYAQAFLVSHSVGFPTLISVPYAPVYHRRGSDFLKASLVFKVRRLRNFYRMCIDYAFRPRLSSRLTLGGRTLPKKP